jgi:general secretion pathway protein I
VYSAGFTLVEVIVALAVVAVALPALLFALSQQIDSTGYLRDKSLANMVANNKLAELRLLTAARRDLLSGRDSGSDELAGREWHWWLQTEGTEVAGFFRVQIDVAAAADGQNQPLVSLVAFMPADFAQAQVKPDGEQ